MPFYDYHCANGHTYSGLRSRDVASETCHCGAVAVRESVYSIGVSGFARPPVDQRQVKMGDYQEASAELEYQQTRRTNVDGSLKPEPQLGSMAKKRAQELQSKGVTDSLDV